MDSWLKRAFQELVTRADVESLIELRETIKQMGEEDARGRGCVDREALYVYLRLCKEIERRSRLAVV